jgi:hypothetical protein
LKVTISVTSTSNNKNGNENGNANGNGTNTPTTDGDATSRSRILEHFISGYHEIKTSVHYQHKLAFPEGGAKPGDLISVRRDFVSGIEFKIHGMDLCRDDA